MTAPFDYNQQVKSMNSEIDSAVAGTEWATFLARRKELVDLMLQSAMPEPAPPAPPDPNDPNSLSLNHVPVAPGAGQIAPSPDQIGQARFWDIPNPERMSAAELQHEIDQRRADVPKEQRTSLTSALFAGGAAAAASAGAAAGLIGHVFENLSSVPFMPSTLRNMLSNDRSKMFWQGLQSNAAEAVEAARAMQPDSDSSAFQFLTGAGTMAGYALPAIAAWEGLGAVAGIPQLSWLGRTGTPLVRVAAKGALTSALLEDPNAPVETKVMNLGLGALLGGASAWGGTVGASIALGTMGAGVGAMVGDTPEDRKRHALEFGVGGAILPMLAPVAASAFAKVRRAFPDGTTPQVGKSMTPFGGLEAEPGTGVPPESDAEWSVINDKPQISGNPVPKMLPGPQGALPPVPETASDLASMLREQPALVLGPEGVPVEAQPSEARNFLIQSEPRALLPARTGDLPGTEYPTVEYSDPQEQQAVLESIKRIQDRETFDYQRNAPEEAKGFASVTRGPAHLLDSKVAAVDGTPLRVFHGTQASFEDFDPTKLDEDALFGPGIYHTESTSIADGYAGDFATTWIDGGHAQAQQVLQALPTATQEADQILFYRALNQTYLAYGIDPAPFQQLGIDITGLLKPASNPNVRPAFLDIKNPLDIDGHVDPYEFDRIMSYLEKEYPDSGPEASINYSEVRQQFQDGEIRTGGDLYHALSGGEITYPGDSLKASFNAILRELGYDGITHIGGIRTGNAPHRVWIAFDPSQVHPAYAPKNLNVTKAQDAAEAITKQATVMESVTLPEAVGKVQITDSDVVSAAKATNPGGVSIVRGVGKPLDIMAEHPDVQFVEREGKLDALIGEFTPEMVLDYKHFGTYEGNVVTTASGIEGEVLHVNGKGMVTLRRTGGGPPLRVKAENVFPSRWGDPMYSVEDMWPSFKADLLRYMNEQSEQAGMAPVQDIWDPRVAGEMQGHLGDYLDRRGITDPATRHVIDRAINESFVNEAKDLDPEARELQGRLGDEATVEANDKEDSKLSMPFSLEEKASPKGFIWLSKPDGDGGILKDVLNPESGHEIRFDTDDAAEEFLKNVDRTAPDLTPASDVPFEVMESVPVGAQFEPQLGYEEELSLMQRDAVEMERQLDKMGAGGGGVGGSEPPAGLPPGSQPPEPQGQLGSGPRQTLGGQFQALYHEAPSKYADLVRRWSGNHLRYSRYMFSALQDSLERVGLDLGKAWEHIEALETSRVKSDNEAHDWLRRGEEIMDEFPPELHRSGFVTRTHEIISDPERYRRWWGLINKGYSQAKIKSMIAADERISDIFHRLYIEALGLKNTSLTPEREIFRYISHIRQRQAQGPLASDSYDPRGLLSPEFEFFAEYARDNNLQFRMMDTRQLLQHYVRSLMFRKYQAEPYANLVRTWQDPRIPESISHLLLDHARAMRYGYQAAPTLGMKAVRGVLEGVLGKVGLDVPISDAEAARLAGKPLGWMYRGMLAGRTSIFFRDGTQPLMALAKVRGGFMAGVYKDILMYWRKGAGREQIIADYETALQHGWVTRDRTPMEGLTVSTFEEQPGVSGQLLDMSPEQVARREKLAKLGDTLLPGWLRKFDNTTNTLKYYGMEQQLNQFISGLSAFRQAKAGLAEFRHLETQAALSGDPSLAMSYRDFAKRSFFSSFQGPIARKLQSLVEAGQDEEAAAMFAREVTKWSQQVYTTREKPEVLRAGFGRMASFLGNFTGQFIEGANAALRYGEPEHRARALMVLGGFSYAMHKAGQALGLRNLENWAWSSALHYVGSPLLEAGAQFVLALGGAAAMADERNPSELQTTAITSLPQLAPVLGSFNPYAGYIKSADALTQAAQGTNPAVGIARYLITGDRGSGIDQLLQSQARAKVLEARLDSARAGMGSLRGVVTPADQLPHNSTHPGVGGQQ